MDVEEAMRERFRQHLPKFVQNINPIELLSYLPCLGDQNSVSMLFKFDKFFVIIFMVCEKLLKCF